MYLPDATTHLLYFLSSNPVLGPSRFLQRPRSDGCMNSRYRCEQQTGQLEAFILVESTNLTQIQVLQPFRWFFLSKHLPDGKILMKTQISSNRNKLTCQYSPFQCRWRLCSSPLTYVQPQGSLTINATMIGTQQARLPRDCRADVNHVKNVSAPCMREWDTAYGK